MGLDILAGKEDPFQFDYRLTFVIRPGGYSSKWEVKLFIVWDENEIPLPSMPNRSLDEKHYPVYRMISCGMKFPDPFVSADGSKE